MDDLDWKKPALIGGLIAGVLPVVPIIGLLNTCFCLWAWVGGIVAAKLLIDRAPRVVTAKDGARIGLFAGLIASAITLLVATPLMFWQIGRLQGMSAILSRSPEVVELFERIQNDFTLKILFSFVSAFINAALTLGFTVLGGVIGVSLFERRRSQPPPPQYPPSYPPQSPYPAQYPPQYPQQPAPSTAYPPQNPPQSGGSSGDQGDQDGQSGQSGQSGWPKE
jgi:hypothetical protein